MEFESRDSTAQRTNQSEQSTEHWSCRANGQLYEGESSQAGAVVYDLWKKDGVKVHSRYSGYNSMTDASYNNNSGIMEKGRVISQDKDYFSFPGIIDLQKSEISVITDKKSKENSVSARIDGVHVDFEKNSSQYKDALSQLSLVDFEPPCRKP